jgi:putative component of toxin-antitoxin plasmid stabilization module
MYGQTILLLLLAGDKISQKKDMRKAQEYFQNYLERGKNG